MTNLVAIDFSYNFFNGTIPSTMSALTSLEYVNFDNNYLTMGTASTVPISTFSSFTLSKNISLSDNCLAFDTTVPYRHVTATHCRPTSKYQLTVASCNSISYMMIIPIPFSICRHE